MLVTTESFFPSKHWHLNFLNKLFIDYTVTSIQKLGNIQQSEYGVIFQFCMLWNFPRKIPLANKLYKTATMTRLERLFVWYLMSTDTFLAESLDSNIWQILFGQIEITKFKRIPSDFLCDPWNQLISSKIYTFRGRFQLNLRKLGWKSFKNHIIKASNFFKIHYNLIFVYKSANYIHTILSKIHRKSFIGWSDLGTSRN